MGRSCLRWLRAGAGILRRAPFALASLSAIWLSLAVEVSAASFIRGDANGDGAVDLSDAVYTLDHLFRGGPPPPCPAAADTNDDEVLDISDAVRTLGFLFRGDPPPPPPYPSPGSDPTPGLGCGLEAPQGLSCRAEGPRAVLSWDALSGYEAIEVLRDGDVVATLPGDALGYTDRPAAGGTYVYTVRGLAGGTPGPGAACTLRGLPSNRPPLLAVLSPAQGAVTDRSVLSVRLRAGDPDGGPVRVFFRGEEVTPPGPPPPPYTLTLEVDVGPGPQLLRFEAADDFGRTEYADLAVGRLPILQRDAAGPGLVVDVSGSSGYAEIERIVRPFLDGIGPLIDQAVRGVVLYEDSFLGVDIRVTGDRAEVTGPIALDLTPSGAEGGRVGMRVEVPRVRLFARGRSDFGFLGTDNWDAVWTGDGLALDGAFALVPAPGGFDTVSEGFRASLRGSSLEVSGFLDPFGIFDALVNFLADLFRDTIEQQVRSAVERTANEELLPAIAEAFSNLKLDLAFGDLNFETFRNDAVESAAGLSLRFDARWSAPARKPDFPSYPGSAAGFAPYPTFPLATVPPHPVDIAISLSEDTLDQALAELAATGAFDTDFDLSGVESPIPLTVGAVAPVLDERLLALEGVEWDTPLALRLRARGQPLVRPGLGAVGRRLIALGDPWRYREGRSEPPPGWTARGFADSDWEEAPGGFGYSSEAGERRALRTEFEDMAAGEFTTLYIRRRFTVAASASIGRLHLRVLYDDGFAAYLNGVEVARVNLPEGALRHDTPASAAVEPTWAEIDLTARRNLLVSGENVLAIEGHNAAATSSDFVLLAELIAGDPPPPGAFGSLPIQIEVGDFELGFLADRDFDGVGAGDADGTPDEVELFAYTLRFTLQGEVQIARSEEGVPELRLLLDASEAEDGGFPPVIVGGAAGLGIEVARRAFDSDEARLIEFADLLLLLFAPALGEALGGFDLPALPLPELAFDATGDGTPDVVLEITRATPVAVDTDGGRPDWICILADVRPASP